MHVQLSHQKLVCEVDFTRNENWDGNLQCNSYYVRTYTNKGVTCAAVTSVKYLRVIVPQTRANGWTSLCWPEEQRTNYNKCIVNHVSEAC